MCGVLCLVLSFVSCSMIMSMLCCLAVCVSSATFLCNPFMLNCNMCSVLFGGPGVIGLPDGWGAAPCRGHKSKQKIPALKNPLSKKKHDWEVQETWRLK